MSCFSYLLLGPHTASRSFQQCAHALNCVILSITFVYCAMDTMFAHASRSWRCSMRPSLCACGTTNMQVPVGFTMGLYRVCLGSGRVESVYAKFLILWRYFDLFILQFSLGFMLGRLRVWLGLSRVGALWLFLSISVDVSFIQPSGCLLYNTRWNFVYALQL